LSPALISRSPGHVTVFSLKFCLANVVVTRDSRFVFEIFGVHAVRAKRENATAAAVDRFFIGGRVSKESTAREERCKWCRCVTTPFLAATARSGLNGATISF
jgi:hypothetical protein